MLRSKKRQGVLVLCLLGVMVLSVIFTISMGAADVPLDAVYGVLMDKLFHQSAAIEAGHFTTAHYQIIWNIRLPRVLMGIITGCGLAICGVVMQSLLLNPIADPFILGVSSGASSGAALALLLPLPFFRGEFQVLMMAIIGALSASLLVYIMAKAGSNGTVQPVTLLLSGTAVNALMNAATSLLIFLAKSNEGIAAVYNWQMGSIASAQWKTLLLPAIGVALGLIIFMRYGRDLDLMMLGEDEAIAMGLNVKRVRTLLMALVAVVVAFLVSVTGIIGFIGLIIPHAARFISKTSSNLTVLPLSALMGGIFLIWADAGARSLFGAAELPLGIVTASIGAPFFFYLMFRQKYKGGARQ